MPSPLTVNRCRPSRAKIGTTLKGNFHSFRSRPWFVSNRVSQPSPAYPRALEALSIEGRVAVEFVIDTSGQVQASSIRILEATHAAFEGAARAAVAKAVFHPARLSGHPVRQLTRQAVRFVIAR